MKHGKTETVLTVKQWCECMCDSCNLNDAHCLEHLSLCLSTVKTQCDERQLHRIGDQAYR